ncbi:hypothetical protein JWV37_08055 [Sulfurospirillum sp. T05]|uniref:Coil containing protein n=1 Tax=Sulfurospirillum tamanense TaxID=2813362 RepID=A0ABS2WSX6_9BACT|nr:hypothetical protein [Sulfurospirillum tamanensis]MBN2964731.1 hypothetical protein [Sulfurospirillum tamanensis]
MQTTEPLDAFERRLDEVKERLQACQKEKTYESCTPCDALFTCTLRKEYVAAVYDSMAKGQGGGFEF